MPQETTQIAYRYSERGVLRQGDLFRARGGPLYKGSRVGYPGRYRLLGIEVGKQRVYLVAVPVDKYGLPCGGSALLYVDGDSYPLVGLPDWIVRPYTVSKLRK